MAAAGLAGVHGTHPAGAGQAGSGAHRARLRLTRQGGNGRKTAGPAQQDVQAPEQPQQGGPPSFPVLWRVGNHGVGFIVPQNAPEVNQSHTEMRGGWKPRRRRALVTTETEERAIAAEASMGESRPWPVSAYPRPAASGMPRLL